MTSIVYEVKSTPISTTIHDFPPVSKVVTVILTYKIVHRRNGGVQTDNPRGKASG